MFSKEVQDLVARFADAPPTSNFKRWEPDLYNKLVTETSFLPNQCRTRQRLWHVANQTTDIPLCTHCGIVPVKWHNDNHEYQLFCSSKCSSNDPSVVEKRTTTMLMKHGVAYYTQSNDFNDKRIATSVSKRGTKWATQTSETQQKIRQTTQERYSSQVYTQSEDYKQKTKATNQRNHNVDYFSQRLEVQRFENSQPEREIVEFLNQHNIKTITNDRTIIKPKELDIWLPEFNCAIEYCGLYWHSTAHERIDNNYHHNKLTLCTTKGIRLITIFEDEWVHKPKLVKSKLLDILGINNTHRIFARQTTVVTVSTKDKQNFFNQCHIQGDGPGSINIGLMHDDELVACMSFIVKSNKVFVLNRYATLYKIPGGFSKLLSYFKKAHVWSEIISFADLRWSTGEVYEKNGFTLDKVLSPDYEYIDLKNLTRIHKFNFRHRNLPKILGEIYDPTKTEVENTVIAGWYRIYNCGLLRYTVRQL